MISEFAKEKVFWTRKMNLKLVQFIEKKPNIWNPKHPKYTSVKHRDKTYAEFAMKYGNEFTGQAVKDRWTNIRSTFANYLRKSKASRINGEETFKVNWHLWEACSFLLKVNKNKKSAALNESQEDEIKDENYEGSSEDDKYSNTSHNEEISCQNIANSILKVFRNVQNDIFDIDNSKNGRIGHLIAGKLTHMNSLEAARISNKIMDTLWLYHEDNPFNPNNVKNEDR